MAKKLLISIVLISIISGIVIAGCGDNGSGQIVVPATGTPTQIASLVTIKGQALEVNGTPIPNAFVVCVNLGLSASLSTLADQLGNYIFRNLPPGTYRIEIWRTEGEHSSSPGSPIGAVNITVTEGSVTVNVTVGTIDPTPTPTATNTPGGPTNTPGGPTNTPGGPTNTPTSTNTPGGPTNTPTATNTPVPAPTITGFTPASGPVGTVVTINGSYFGSAPTVRFNGIQATTVNVNGTGTQITATVPTGATTGKITVTTTAGTGTSADNFTVTVYGWKKVTITAAPAPDATTTFRDIFFINDTGWVTADNGYIYYTTDGGTTFTALQTPVSKSKKIQANGISNFFYSIYMIDANTGYAVSSNGNVYKTENHGITWTKLSGSPEGSPMLSIDFPPGSNPAYGYCCNNATESNVYKINTSSSSVAPMPTPDDTFYYLRSISFPSIEQGWTCGDSFAYPYNNNVWNGAESGGEVFTGLFFLDNTSLGWMVGERSGGNCLVKHYTGSSWDYQNISPAIPGTLYDVFFIDQNNGWAVGGNTGIIISTSNGGTTWTAQDSTITSGTLTSVFFTSANKGYAAGSDNTFLIYGELIQ